LHAPKIIEFYLCISLLQKCKVVSFLLDQLVLYPRCGITELICKEYLTTA